MVSTDSGSQTTRLDELGDPKHFLLHSQRIAKRCVHLRNRVLQDALR
jgi:hypothetical protein